MKLNKPALLLAACSLAACSDKGDEEAGADGTSLIDKAGQMNSELVETVKEKSQAAAESVGQSVDAAKQAVSESVDAAKEAGTEMLASAETATQSLTSGGSAADTAVADSSESAADQAQSLANDTAVAADKTETAVMETAAVTTAALDPQSVTEGKRVYSGSCMSCHAPGIAGAPKVGDAAIWQPRVAKGMDTLYQHALIGYKGSTGYMPPKGGFASLNDAEVKAAVDYMVSASQ